LPYQYYTKEVPFVYFEFQILTQPCCIHSLPKKTEEKKKRKKERKKELHLNVFVMHAGLRYDAINPFTATLGAPSLGK